MFRKIYDYRSNIWILQQRRWFFFWEPVFYGRLDDVDYYASIVLGLKFDGKYYV